MLRVLNLEAGYEKLRVLKSLSLHVSPGEIVTIIGANGAGKSTLLKTISGLIKAQAGKIYFNEQRIDNLAAEKILGLGCAFVPEGRQIFGPMTVRENLILGSYLLLKNSRKKEKIKQAHKNIQEVLTLFPILKQRQKQLAGTLSGGEQQMLAIGRALMVQPQMLLMDEPSMGIAPLIAKEVFKTIRELRNKGMTILLIEQNAKAALNIADRGYVIETGQIVLEGTSQELLNNQDVQRAYLGKDYKKIDE